MESLRERLLHGNDFVVGFELVSTRGTMSETRSLKIRELANELAGSPWLDWLSITDNAGGNPMLGPTALGKPILYAGKEVVIHLSCKDFNRNGLESQAWQLSSEGFHNVLALSGDYPLKGHEGNAKPVFDIDSVGLLTMLSHMNEGYQHPTSSGARQLERTDFFSGAVVNNFKLRENEVMPQYLKLEKKIECGAQFIINQIGYDSRKIHELKIYMDRTRNGSIPLIGNVYVLNARVTELFYTGRIPGVVISPDLMALSRRHAASPDRGKSFYHELAAKQIAIYRGLGYRGVYLGGLHDYAELDALLAMERSFGADDWKSFAREIGFSRPGEFFLMAPDGDTGLCDEQRVNPEYERSLVEAQAKPGSISYWMSEKFHDLLFTPGKGFHRIGHRLYKRSENPSQGPAALRLIERASKAALFGCRDCGDCSLPDIAFLCPESQCAKNQRNGPCGGTRDGKCEVEEFECIWSRAYDRLKSDGKSHELLNHAPVIQNQALRGTSSWSNHYLGRDNHGIKARRLVELHKKQADDAAAASVAPPVAPVESK